MVISCLYNSDLGVFPDPFRELKFTPLQGWLQAFQNSQHRFTTGCSRIPQIPELVRGTSFGWFTWKNQAIKGTCIGGTLKTKWKSSNRQGFLIPPPSSSLPINLQLGALGHSLRSLDRNDSLTLMVKWKSMRDTKATLGRRVGWGDPTQTLSVPPSKSHYSVFLTGLYGKSPPPHSNHSLCQHETKLETGKKALLEKLVFTSTVDSPKAATGPGDRLRPHNVAFPTESWWPW